jgi:2,5-diketo-D-gluconate reductase A
METDPVHLYGTGVLKQQKNILNEWRIIMEYLNLNNGTKIPAAGIGTFLMKPQEAQDAVTAALKNGYELVDTANAYMNEEQVGSTIKKSGIGREELFLTTKVWVEHYGYEECRKSVLTSLEKLGTDYIDLMLLHQPFNDYYGAYRALEDLYEEGKLRAIGVSNFYPDRLVDLASFTKIPPMVNQVETHIFNQQKTAKEYMDKYKVQMEAWAPFGEGRGGTFDNPVIAEIAAKYGKSTAQVMLRWHIQRGVVVIPKSTHKERMAENFNVFDFALSDEDMAKIAALDAEKSSFFSHYDPAMVEWFVQMVEERKKQHDSSKGA